MKRIGVRELRQHASEYLRMVKAGETIEITERGEPVAILQALPPESPYQRMVREGRIRPASGNALDVEPLQPLPGVPTLSEALEEERASYER